MNMENMARLNWVDLLIVIVCLRMSYVAFQDGLSHGIFPLLGTIVTLILSLHYYKKIGLLISKHLFNLPIDVADLIALIFIVLISFLLFKISRSVLDKVIQVSWHPLIEKFGGLVFGVIRAAVVASMVLIVIALIPVPYLQWSIRDRSLLGIHFVRIGPKLYENVARFFPDPHIKEKPIDVEVLVQEIVRDKYTGAPKAGSRVERTHEWERPLNQ